MEGFGAAPGAKGAAAAVASTVVCNQGVDLGVAFAYSPPLVSTGQPPLVTKPVSWQNGRRRERRRGWRRRRRWVKGNNCTCPCIRVAMMRVDFRVARTTFFFPCQCQTSTTDDVLAVTTGWRGGRPRRRR